MNSGQGLDAENRALREENAKLKQRVAKLTKTKVAQAAAIATAGRVCTMICAPRLLT